MERVTFINSRTLTLVGNFHTAASDAAVIFAHGFTSDKSALGRFDSLSQFLNKSGYNVLAFDLSGCGESDADSLASHNMVDDLQSAIAFVRSRGCRRIALYGHSLGGLICLKCVSPDIVTMVLSGTPTDRMDYDWKEYYSADQLKEMKGKGYFKAVDRTGKERTIGRQVLMDFEEINQEVLLANVMCPVLLIHGNDPADEEGKSPSRTILSRIDPPSLWFPARSDRRSKPYVSGSLGQCYCTCGEMVPASHPNRLNVDYLYGLMFRFILHTVFLRWGVQTIVGNGYLRSFMKKRTFVLLVALCTVVLVDCSPGQWITVNCPEEGVTVRVPRKVSASYGTYGRRYESEYRGTVKALGLLVSGNAVSDSLREAVTQFRQYVDRERSAIQTQLRKMVARLQKAPCEKENRKAFQLLLETVNLNAKQLHKIAAACSNTKVDVKIMLEEYQRDND